MARTSFEADTDDLLSDDDLTTDGDQAEDDEQQDYLDIFAASAESDKVVVDFVNQHNVGMIAFIAPFAGVRLSPVEMARATISAPDEFGIETIIHHLTNSDVETVYVVINSPGGDLQSSYKIARALRYCLKAKRIVTFVPYIAASGGTLLSLVGNEIVMGPMSNLSPIDPQLYYKGTWISATCAQRVFERAIKWFEKLTPDEAPYPKRALVDKLDPYIMEEWNGNVGAAVDYIQEILSFAGYSGAQAKQIARELVSYPTHSYVITLDKARAMGLNVKESSDQEYAVAWKVMHHWLSQHMFRADMFHAIRYALPKPVVAPYKPDTDAPTVKSVMEGVAGNLTLGGEAISTGNRRGGGKSS